MPPKKPRSRWDQLPWVRKSAVVAGFVGTVASAVVAGANAARIGEPYWIATRGLVREEIQASNDKTTQAIDSVAAKQLKMQLFIARDQRQRLENEIASKNILIQQNPNTSREVQSAIEEQLRTLSRDLESVKREIDALSSEQNGRLSRR